MEGPLAEVDDGGEGEDAGEEVGVGREVRYGEGDEVADGRGAGEGVPSVRVEGLGCCVDGLVRRAGCDALGGRGVELGVRLVEEDGCGVEHHVRLEEHFVDSAVAVQRIALRWWEVERPVRKEGLYLGHIGVGGGGNGWCPHELAEVAGAQNAVGEGRERAVGRSYEVLIFELLEGAGRRNSL